MKPNNWALRHWSSFFFGTYGTYLLWYLCDDVVVSTRFNVNQEEFRQMPVHVLIDPVQSHDEDEEAPETTTRVLTLNIQARTDI